MVKGYTIRIESELLQKLHIVSAYEGRSANSQILKLIRNCIEDYEKEHGEIELKKEE